MSSKPPTEVEHDQLVLQPRNPIELNQDCLLEILSWLPAKNICKLQCLNRSTCNLYSDRLLRKLQTLRARTDSGIFVHNSSSLSSFEKFFLHGSSGVPPESIEFMLKNSRKIVASSNGLIVFQTTKGVNKSSIGDLCVFNPMLQTLAPISSPPDFSLDDKPRIGVTCTSASDGLEYNIILVTMKLGEHPHEWRTVLECHRYSSKNMSWEYLKAIDDSGRRSINLENPVFVSGSIYWASDTGSYMSNTDPYILAFDVEKRTSKLMPLPEEARKVGIDNYMIQVAPWTNKSLCLIQYIKLRAVVIWVLESTSSRGSWMKVHEVDLVSLELGDVCQTLGSFTIINGELLVFTAEDCLYVYRLKDKQLKKLGEHNQGLYPQLRPYANTFHPCGKFEHKKVIE
ncbi:F-box domain-containing protein [Dioscorea alata]|uniref:F-box domain-containing protein n=1 Tax=Dioscorea alata TaxID=55571 RepID=A0ACB7WV64_DIOAL|nr:F-box domain-containing protein [Dioscorea alata]